MKVVGRNASLMNGKLLMSTHLSSKVFQFDAENDRPNRLLTFKNLLKAGICELYMSDLKTTSNKESGSSIVEKYLFKAEHRAQSVRNHKQYHRRRS